MRVQLLPIQEQTCWLAYSSMELLRCHRWNCLIEGITSPHALENLQVVLVAILCIEIVGRWKGQGRNT